jgi:FkbM family methyltransferase
LNNFNLKSFIYKTGINCLRMFWRVRGGRTIKAFDEKYCITVDTIFPDHRKFRLPQKGCLSEIVRYTDYVQLHSVVNYLSQLKSQPTVVDIGAHYGAYAVVIGKIVQKLGGRVIAVEPNPQSFDVLKQNICLNELENTVMCEQVAIADKTGRMNLELLGAESKITSKQANNSHIVEVITLEQLLKKHKINYVDLMIIDVEGAELAVLRGFPWQSASVDKLFCEFHPYAWKDFGYNKEDMRQFLALHGYRCFDMYFAVHEAFDSEAYIGPTFLYKSECS